MRTFHKSPLPLFDAGGGFSPEYQAVINYANAQGYTLPSAGQQTKQDTLITALKAAGVNGLADFYLIRILANDASDGANLGFSGINWANPGANIPTPVNAPLKTINLGYSSDGSTKYIDENFKLVTAGCIDNDIFSGIYLLGNASSTFRNGMVNTNAGIMIMPRDSSNSNFVVGRAVSTVGSVRLGSAQATSEGFTVVGRSDDTQIRGFKNGVSLGSAASAKVTMGDTTHYSLCAQSFGSPANFAPSSLNIAINIFGRASMIDQAALYTALNNYITSL